MIILKIGGGRDINVAGIISDAGKSSERFVIVHGANSYRDELALKVGSEKKVLTSVSGYTSVYSDETAIDILMMAYAGLRNKRIVELCQQSGINAVGLSGIDGKLVQGKRNSGIRVNEDGKTKIVRDFSGKPQIVNAGLLEMLLNGGYTPVICVPIIDENNFAINSENDDIINVIQKSLNADRIIQFIEAPGFLRDKSDPESLIKKITRDEIKNLEEKSEGRMKRKMMAIRKLFDEGAAEVIICDGRTEHPLEDALANRGTIIN